MRKQRSAGEPSVCMHIDRQPSMYQQGCQDICAAITIMMYFMILTEQ